MLHLLFFIFKILAIIVASILGILLLLLLLVLFVPVRYQVDLRKHADLVVKARVNWLLRIVFARVWFLDGQLHLRLRIFGVCLYDNLRSPKEKPDKTKKKEKVKEKKKEKKSKTRDRTFLQEEEGKEYETIEHKAEDYDIEHYDIEEHKIEEYKNYSIEEHDVKDYDIRNYDIEEHITKENVIRTDQAKGSIRNDHEKRIKEFADFKAKHNDLSKENDIRLEVESMEPNPDHKADMEMVTDKDVQAEDEVKAEETLNSQKKSNVWKKIKAFLTKIQSLIRKFFSIGSKVKKVISNSKEKIKSISSLIKGLWHKKNLIMTFLKNEINKAGIKITLKRVWEILKHCAPKRIRGKIRYGTGDPCSTGEVFAVAAMFYAKYGNSLILEADFEEEVLQAEVMARGRIRIFTLLIIAIRLIRDRNFRQLLNHGKQLKEEL